MNVQSITIAIMSLIAGIGVFLIACKMMSTCMETLSGEKLKSMFQKVSSNAFLGVGIGAFATAIIQSSGATTVMVLGFVNAQIMSMFQATTLIYGASIGTTITGQIVALGMFGAKTISTTVIFSTFAGIGAFITLFAKTAKWKNIGAMLAGFGMLFVGLSMMSSSMSEFAQDPSIKNLLQTVQNPIVVILIGTFLTALINSSSVMTSIAITMVFSGLIDLDQGINLALGSNIGACITGVMASLTGTTAAKRCAFVNVIYKTIGVILFVIIGYLMGLFSDGSLTFGTLFEKMFPKVPQTQLAMFHTFFNCAIVLIIMPFTKPLIEFSKKVIKERISVETDEDQPRLSFINDNMLRTPAVAVAQLKNEIENMAQVSLVNFNRACEIVCSLDYKDLDQFRKDEVKLNYINKQLMRFSVKLSNLLLSESDRRFVSTTFKTISDLERVGDYAENIVEYADSLKNNEDKFSEEAVKEIEKVRLQVNKLYEEVMKAYMKNDLSKLYLINQLEDGIDDMTKKMELNHIKRLEAGECSVNVGAQYLSLATNIERIGVHYLNVVKAVDNSNLISLSVEINKNFRGLYV